MLDDRPGYALEVLPSLSRAAPVLLVTASRSPHYLADLLEGRPDGLVVCPILPFSSPLAYYLSRVVAGERFYEGPPPTPSPLTRGEREVLRRLAFGEPVPQPANQARLRVIREKLGAARDPELVLAYFVGDAATLAM